MTAEAISAALGLRRSGSHWHGACPLCEYPDAFTVKEGLGQVLVHCHAGCEQRAVLDWLRSNRLWQQHQPPTMPVPLPRPLRTDRSASIWLVTRLWNEARPAAGTLVETYLRSRRLRLPPGDSLRFLPCHRHIPNGSNHPVMIAAVRNGAGRLMGVHRTYLRADGTGKAAIEPAKMTLGQLAGGAVQLTGACIAMTVCEGIEPGLAIWTATGRAVWPALSTGGLRRLILPALPLAADVTIAADADPPGLEAAEAAAARWHAEGRRVTIAPAGDGLDYNDMLMADAAGGAP